MISAKGNDLICNRLAARSFADQWLNPNGIPGITTHEAGGVVISIPKSELVSQDLAGLKA